ncbi:MAG: iron ABC transporter permease [Pseudomonadota bacterium]
MSNKLYLSLWAAIVVLLALACTLGSTPLPLSSVLAALLGQGDPLDVAVVWEVRLPRALAAIVVGSALGGSGAALQGLLRNPLAEPGVLGVSATAALLATFTIYYGFAIHWQYAVPLAAIAGALIATTLIVFALRRANSIVALILVGVGLSSFSAALMSLLLNFAPHPFSLSDMINWTLGSVANRSVDDLLLVLPFLLTGCIILWRTRAGLAVLTLGEEAAAGVGLNVRQQRIWVTLGAGISTGAAVALAGAIGFVGIVAPHLVRPWVNYDAARTLLPSALLAAALVLAADILVRIVPTTTELKLGVAAALFGAPMFVWIAIQRDRHAR